jgi:transposase InsO family protein
MFHTWKGEFPMLSNIEIGQWYKRLNLSDGSQAVINQIRTSQPVRSVQSFKDNVIGRYPSQKMGLTIQFESHKNEFAFIYEYEHGDDDVLEYYDQSSTIKLDYEAANGRHLGILHTPDFFVLRVHSAGWEECKTEEELIKLSAKNSNRYFKDSEGVWRCPPGEAYAARFGFYYRVRCSSEINWSFQRNAEFLEDYLRSDSQVIAEKTYAFIIEQVTAKPGISLRELFERTVGVATRDDVFMMIATGGVYVDLKDVPLVEFDRVCVFPNRDVATAHINLVRTVAQIRSTLPRFVDISVGSYIEWDNHTWKIVNVGETISLMGEDYSFTEIPFNAFENLVHKNRITGITLEASSSLHPEAKRLLEQADRQAYSEANRRYQIIQAYINGDPIPLGGHVSERTKRRLKAKFYLAEERYGIGYVGLLPCRNRGNAKEKLPLPTRVLINDFIKNHYETYKQRPKSEVYASFRLACKQQGVIPASYKTFIKAIARRSRHAQVSSRQGPKAAYTYKEFYLELTSTMPRHGERPFHIAHLDHTELDVELVCSTTGQNLGRPWATFLTDAYSRRLLAVSLTYEKPSYRSCMMILRELVRRFGRFPQIAIVDGGKEFASEYFDTLLAIYRCTKKTRPPAKSRFGSICERLFGTTNTRFIHNLQGNTQITKNVRQVTKSVNPKEHAVWTLEKLYLYLREWAYEVYDTIEHPALGQCPRDAFIKGILITGERKHILIPYDEDFRIRTFPTTPKTTAKVSPGRGVKINNFYYWSDAFRHPEVEGARVSVRYDPFNAGRSFAYVREQWVECYSERYATFRGRSEREVMIATSELRRQQTRHSRQLNITATKLAHFLESVESEEVLLRQQLADKATRNVLDMINAVPQPRIAEATNQHMTSEVVSDEGAGQSTSLNLDTPSKTTQLEVYGEF